MQIIRSRSLTAVAFVLHVVAVELPIALLPRIYTQSAGSAVELILRANLCETRNDLSKKQSRL